MIGNDPERGRRISAAGVTSPCRRGSRMICRVPDGSSASGFDS